MNDSELFAALVGLRQQVVAASSRICGRLDEKSDDPAISNLADYLALRDVDVRPLQRELAWRGLSSLGRLESRVLPTIDAALWALGKLSNRVPANDLPGEAAFFAGEALLGRRSAILFGPAGANRRARIMVTLPAEAAGDVQMVDAFADRGMDIARINCAHDDEAAWRSMAANVRRSAQRLGRPIPVLFDIAGPKIRTERVAVAGKPSRLGPGDLLRLVASSEPHLDATARFAASVSLPEIVPRLSVGDRVGYNDGKLEGVVESLADGEALVRVRSAQAGGCRLKPEKGVNFPDSDLGLAPLTQKDRTDLRVVADCADLVGYSFVSEPADIDLLEQALSETGPRPLGLILKLERPQAVSNLPRLIARASGKRPFGVMIARGDLAAEIGFERLAEVQEEILWVCEAASVPVVWATQVLDDLARTGVASRGEMTDAAMAARAECVMLNKGPAITVAIEVLDRLLARMDRNIVKKTPTLRPLGAWQAL